MIKVGKNTELHSMEEWFRAGDDEELDADCDKISNIAISWLLSN